MIPPASCRNILFREAVEVIDELEALFQQEYNDFVKDRDAT